MTLPQHTHLASAKRTLEIELAALSTLGNALTTDFSELVEAILRLNGHVVVMGLGKSGHIGRKISASLASTGTPSFFVHPTEAGHGDLGMITARDLVLVLSNSGEQEELNLVLPLIRRLQVSIAAITSKQDSSLASFCDYLLLTPAVTEACPNNLAPTSSTLLQLALGDALTVACLEGRGFSVDDFARSHPSGALGRRLLLRVQDIMVMKSELPVVDPTISLIDAMPLMSSSGFGFVVSTDELGRVEGIFTDGDLRRAILKNVSVVDTTVAQSLTISPKSVNASTLCVDALNIMESSKITSLLVVDDSQGLVGAINMNMLLKAKII